MAQLRARGLQAVLLLRMASDQVSRRTITQKRDRSEHNPSHSRIVITAWAMPQYYLQQIFGD